MSKSFWSVALLVITSTIAKASDSAYTITGQFEEVKSGTIELTIYGNEAINSSAKISHGAFLFKGVIQNPSQAVLTIKNGKDDYVTFYIEPGTINIRGKGFPLKDLVISSPVNDDYWLLQQKMEPVTKWQEANTKARNEAAGSKNETMLDSLDDVDFEVLKEKRKIIASFVNDHPHSMLSAIAIKENYLYYAKADDVAPVYDLLDESVKNTAAGKEINDLIAKYQRVAVGSIPPDITQPTPQGTSMSLSSLKGNYVLVDFWASWCGPCRRENPNVVKLYSQYKDKGFEIFSVSYDEKKEKWEKAIKDDKLGWNHVSDLKGWNNATSDLYGIKAIPSNFLVDKEGKIIAKNLFGKKLAATLANVIK